MQLACSEGALSLACDQGSVVFPRLGSQRQESVRTLRTDLKQEIKRAWAQVQMTAPGCWPDHGVQCTHAPHTAGVQEAVSRGVVHAKKQDYPAALACYR